MDTAATGPGTLTDRATEEKREKSNKTGQSTDAIHWPFAVETMGALSEQVLQLFRKIHSSAEAYKRSEECERDWHSRVGQ